MTKNEAKIIGAYTGFLCGDFSELHEYIEKIMDRPVFTHEMGDKDVMLKVREAAKPDFLNIIENLSEASP